MPSYTVGQALAALHGDPAVAYNKKSEIWALDNLYAKYFAEDTTAQHIVFAFSLIRAIEARKLSLIARQRSADDLKMTESKELDFFRGRGATYIYAAAIGASLGTLLNRKIPNKFRVSFGPKTSPKRAQALWESIITATASLTVHLAPALDAGMKADALKRAIDTFSSLMEATMSFNEAIYSAFGAKAIVS